MNILSSADLFGLKPNWTSLSLDSTISDRHETDYLFTMN